MIVLFTDFGLEGPYVGQVKAVLWREADGVPVVDLIADAPPFDPKSGAYLLAAYAEAFHAGTIFLAVVDPGVGSARGALVLRSGERWFVGPDNGLLAIAARRRPEAEVWAIEAMPEKLSASFHGRDLFAPAAAALATGRTPSGQPVAPGSLVGHDWPDDLDRVVYIDRFGNALTGLRATALGDAQYIYAAGRRLPRARSFFEVPPGDAFWYENANGLAEIAVNQGRAADMLGLSVGDPVRSA